MTLMMRILVKMIISIIHYNCISQTWGDLDLPYVCHLKINIGRGIVQLLLLDKWTQPRWHEQMLVF
ncbi:unnamed protein product, partial [Musa hybrid cultivar]